MPSRRGSREPESEARTLLNNTDQKPDFSDFSKSGTPADTSRKASRKSSAFAKVGHSIRKSFNVVGEAYDKIEDDACAGGSGTCVIIYHFSVESSRNFQNQFQISKHF